MPDSADRRLPPALQSFSVEFLAAIEHARQRENTLPHRAHLGWRGRLERLSVAGVALATVAAAATLVVLEVSGSGSAALAATPPPLVYHAGSAQSGRAVLLRLAAVAARQPVPSKVVSGRFAYVKSAGWYLTVRVAGATVTSTIVPSVTESWTRPDGHGRVIRRKAKANGARVTETNGGPVFEDFTVPSGVGRAYPLLRLSTDPAVVARQLNAGNPPKRTEPAERSHLANQPKPRTTGPTKRGGDDPPGARNQSGTDQQRQRRRPRRAPRGRCQPRLRLQRCAHAIHAHLQPQHRPPPRRRGNPHRQTEEAPRTPRRRSRLHGLSRIKLRRQQQEPAVMQPDPEQTTLRNSSATSMATSTVASVDRCLGSFPTTKGRREPL